MSSEIEKEKRSKRLYSTETVIKSRAKVAKKQGLLKETETHRYDKLHPLDCGNPNCLSCRNPRRMWNQETFQEKRAKQDKVQEE